MTNRQNVVITGGASGIGAAAARCFAGAGYAVAIGYHPADPHDPALVLEDIHGEGGVAAAFPVDVRDTGQVAAFLADAAAQWGRVDHVIANAGILRRAALGDLTDDAWNEVIDIDLTGVMRTVRAALPYFPEAGGSVVAVSSIVGANYGWAEHAHYAAAKAGVLGLVQSLAQELGPRGIRVNAVVPGTIESPQSLDATHSLGQAGIDQQAALLPLAPRTGTVEDVAAAIGFLASDAAGFITGTSLLVDGGLGTVSPR
ncbi:SDR family NAD(P)-dependent oxidoreductase [Microbacterium foliorum]|uniref:SDR family NAD(P)-dependent oxidoreductase n=1 Tax=Microbacterium foliorum TaxID=104336 RepID=UPI001D3D4548|nr:SDR family NAD(P)-dependent oxidoreductase [Microbacterium foliorum]CAH0177112.1 3-oxoacyl-[acyl-carrier-protein] reductase FabG [Microbacterium foliorum]CAH0206585.1 3-oxoacyl-[acyl-carrier-protein] reductase FabG [Microbacterium foliorum]